MPIRPTFNQLAGKTRYHEDMTDGDHLDLVDLLLHLKGMCLLSGYKTSIYEPLEMNGWKREKIETVCFSVHIARNESGEVGTKKPARTEYLWMSPNLQKALEENGSTWIRLLEMVISADTWFGINLRPSFR